MSRARSGRTRASSTGPVRRPVAAGGGRVIGNPSGDRSRPGTATMAPVLWPRRRPRGPGRTAARITRAYSAVPCPACRGGRGACGWGGEGVNGRQRVLSGEGGFGVGTSEGWEPSDPARSGMTGQRDEGREGGEQGGGRAGSRVSGGGLPRGGGGVGLEPRWRPARGRRGEGCRSARAGRGHRPAAAPGPHSARCEGARQGSAGWTVAQPCPMAAPMGPPGRSAMAVSGCGHRQAGGRREREELDDVWEWSTRAASAAATCRAWPGAREVTRQASGTGGARGHGQQAQAGQGGPPGSAVGARSSRPRAGRSAGGGVAGTVAPRGRPGRESGGGWGRGRRRRRGQAAGLCGGGPWRRGRRPRTRGARAVADLAGAGWAWGSAPGRPVMRPSGWGLG